MFDKRYRPVTFRDWMVTYLLLCIPVVNIVLLLVWAFGDSVQESKTNWAKALLVWMLIGTIIPLALAFSMSFALPLMPWSQVRAMTAEGKAGLSKVLKAEKRYCEKYGTFVNVNYAEELPGIKPGDLQGTYFDHDSFCIMAAGPDFVIISAEANGNNDIDGNVILTMEKGITSWSGSLLDQGVTSWAGSLLESRL